MDYIKVKVSFKLAPDRLYRVLLVPEHTELLQLAHIIGDSMHFAWGHLFEFEKGNTAYIAYPDEDELDLDYGDRCIRLDMLGHTIEELGEKATFEYDYGDDWTFDVRIYKRRIRKDESKPAFLIEGAGQGIWEDAIGILCRFLNDGAAAVEAMIEDYRPWNIPGAKYADFDAPLDIAKEQAELEDALESIHELPDDVEEDDDEDEPSFADMQEMMSKLKELDHYGTDKAVHKCVLKALTELTSRYDEIPARLMVYELLMSEAQALFPEIEDM